MSTDRAELHRLVDELGDQEVAEAAEVLRGMRPPAEVPAQPQRQLSFIGAYDSGRSDVATRSAEILADELGAAAEPHNG